MRTLGLVFALLILACASPTDPGPFPDGTIVLDFGKSAQLERDLRVTFAEVVEDSRCPTSVTCVWQGNGAIRLDVTSGAGSQSAKLNTVGGSSFPREAVIAGYTFTLVELNPPRQTTDPVPPQQYRATIRVTRAQ